MKNHFTLLSRALALIAILVVTISCNRDVEALAPTNEREPITFNVSNETVTRGAIVTEINEFVVYAVDVDGAVIGNATFTKNDEGVWSPDNTLYWTGNEIKFYAYLSSSNFTAAEGTTLSYQMPTDVTAQDDLMVAQFTASSGAVTLSFERIMALIQFSVKDASYAVTSVSLSGISDAGAYDMAIKAWSSNEPTNASYTAGIDTTVADGGDEGTQITNKSGYLMVLPQSQASVTVTATNENGKEKEYTLANINWEAGKLYNYTINLVDIEPQTSTDAPTMELLTSTNDYLSNDASNCYIINPSTSTQRVYHIPVEGRINKYWIEYDPVEAYQIGDKTRGGIYAEQLWSDCGISAAGGSDELTVGLAVKDGVKIMQVVVPAGYSKAGNAVYAVKNADGVVLWSWHLWVTDYAPASTFMDRFVGQKANYYIAGTMLYQFGRKDPFINTDGAYDANTMSSVSNAINNPTTVYGTTTAAARYWAYSTSVAGYESSGISRSNTAGVWGDRMLDPDDHKTVKSIFDPSPLGYRMPYSTSSTSQGVGNQTWDLYSFTTKTPSYYSTYYLCISPYYFPYTKDVTKFNNSSKASKTQEVVFWTSQVSKISSPYEYNFFWVYNGSSSVFSYWGYEKDLLPIFPIKES